MTTRKVLVDLALMSFAQSFFDSTISELDEVAQRYADQFHRSVIQPFCRRHNLRFWSGMGTWWFESKGGTKIDPEDAAIRWSLATSNARLTVPGGDVRDLMFSPRWVMTCGEEDLPMFLQVLREIDKQLMQDFMGGCLGYWICDFNPWEGTDGAAS